jgi:hypothetical protein
MTTRTPLARLHSLATLPWMCWTFEGKKAQLAKILDDGSVSGRTWRSRSYALVRARAQKGESVQKANSAHGACRRAVGGLKAP